MTNVCGANNYFYDNRTIHFIVTGQLNCKVQVSLKNTLQITTQLSVKNSTFSAKKFIDYSVQQLGGNPQNYKILGTKKHKKRILQEDHEEFIVDVDWAIVDDAEVGTESSLQSEQKLNVFASALESFNLPNDIGIVLLILKCDSYYNTQLLQHRKIFRQHINLIQIKIHLLAVIILRIKIKKELNFIFYYFLNFFQTFYYNITNNSTLNNSTEESQTGDSAIIYIFNEGVNVKKSQKMKTQSGQSSSTSTTATIIVSVICPIVGVSLIIFGFFYYRKLKNDKQAALKAKKYTFDTIKIDAIDPQIPMKVTQQQSIM